MSLNGDLTRVESLLCALGGMLVSVLLVIGLVLAPRPRGTGSHSRGNLPGQTKQSKAREKTSAFSCAALQPWTRRPDQCKHAALEQAMGGYCDSTFRSIGQRDCHVPVCQLRVVVSVQGGTHVVGGSASLCKHAPSTNDNRWMCART